MTTRLTNHNITYQEFLNKIETSLIICNNLSETEEDILFTSNSNDIVVFLSTDLEYGDNHFLQATEEKYNHFELLRSEQPLLNNIKSIKCNFKRLIYVFYKVNYWDNCTYESIFYLLFDLLDHLKENNINKVSLKYEITLTNSNYTK